MITRIICPSPDLNLSTFIDFFVFLNNTNCIVMEIRTIKPKTIRPARGNMFSSDIVKVLPKVLSNT